ncbi:MAG: HIT domain-containing protein [Holosporales bacterium]|jgi:histidine triad (HIT) family protein|nr:HIT domain-containing protein [Holosporales bacterium]
MQYDKNNPFYKIINKEIKTNIVSEGKHYLAFNDITPKAPVHVLIIPKGNYVDYNDFASNASDEEIIDFNRGIAKIVKLMKLEANGFKILSNAGKFTLDGEKGQEVMHMHVHILGKSSEE